MPHLPPTHHETSKHDFLNERKIKEKQNKIVLHSNSNLAKSMAHHIQTKELTTWFVIKFSGISRILQSIYNGFLQNSQANDEAA
jgi:hypothetical protein